MVVLWSLSIVYGLDDGVVKVWRDYANPNSKPQLVTSWRAIHDMLPTTNKSEYHRMVWCMLKLLTYYFDFTTFSIPSIIVIKRCNQVIIGGLVANLCIDYCTDPGICAILET